MAQQPGEVVLDDEGPGRARHLHDLPSPVGCEDGAGRVLVGRLAVQQPRAAEREGVGEQFRAQAVLVDRDRQRAQVGGAGGGDRAGVGGRLDQDGRAGCRDGPESRGEGVLAARGDDDVLRPRSGAHAPREDRSEGFQAVAEGAVPGVRAARGPGQRGRQGAGGLQGAVQVAAVEPERAGRRRSEDVGHRPGVDGAVGERDGLPGGVAAEPGAEGRAGGVVVPAEAAEAAVAAGPARPAPRRDIGSAAGPGSDEPLGGEKRYRTRDRYRAHAMPPYQLSAAGQPVADGELGYQGPQPTRQHCGSAIV
ncbi:hypothetical protein GCM10009839_78620 [Catenulispora yoronensis]|uniref:Uncharacterized protein n=1 Tax=Catenulispora yoronensis TaxID=450799 RepID=A0ABP5GXG7_9ACTN